MTDAPRVPLRRRLFLLAAAGLVPVVIMSGIGLYALARQQRNQAERIGLELARALASAVDAELRSSISVLQSLATTVSIDPKNLAAFRHEVQPVLETQPTWAAVFLADPTGHRLVDTRFPVGATLPMILETASFDRVLRTRAPTVGGLARGPGGVMLFPVRAPVIRRGEVQFVLTALVKPDGILSVITRQRVPPDWIISIFDEHGLRVARSRAHQETLGGRALHVWKPVPAFRLPPASRWSSVSPRSPV